MSVNKWSATEQTLTTLAGIDREAISELSQELSDLSDKVDNIPSSSGESGLSSSVAQAIYNLLIDAIYVSNNHADDLAKLQSLIGNSSDTPSDNPNSGTDTPTDEPETTITLTSISATNTLSEFTVGQAFNTGGITVKATYSDGTSKNVDGWEASSVDTSTAGTKTCTITYTEDGITKTTTTSITVKATEVTTPVLSSITATNTLSEFTVGQSFDTSGIKVTAHYSDNTTKQVSGWTTSTVDTSTAGTKTCTITYTEDGVTKTTTISITVKAQETTEPTNPSDTPSNGDAPDDEGYYVYTVNADKTLTNSHGTVIHTLDNTYDYSGEKCLTTEGYTLTEATSNIGLGFLFKCESSVEVTANGSSRALFYINDSGSLKSLTGSTAVGTVTSLTKYYTVFRRNSTSGAVPNGIVFKTTSPIEIITE